MNEAAALPLSYLVASGKPRIAPPEGEKPPLLLLLHGVGSNERDLAGLAPLLDGRLVVLSLRAPVGLGPGAFGWYPVQWTAEGPVGDPVQARASRDAIVQFIAGAVEKYGADSRRVYLMGFSQGAIMSLYVALTQPETVAGIVAMSGRLLPEAFAERVPEERLSGLPILAVHGTSDTVLPISEGRQINARLSSLPLAFSYREYEGMGHEVTQQSLGDIAAWLTSRLDAAG